LEHIFTLEQTSILVGIPHRTDLVNARLLTAVVAMLFEAAGAGFKLELHQVFGNRLDDVRNRIVRYFLSDPHGTHLLFLDDDTLPPPDAVQKLVARKLPIVSGLYNERNEPHRPIIFDAPVNEKGELSLKWRHQRREEVPPETLLECDVIPAGILLVERRVFEDLKPPWFHTEKSQEVGEDVYFSLHARRHGYKIHIDTGVDCVHIVTHATGSVAALERWKRDFDFTVEQQD
jgi:GT2 family glycosyltransferase